jgi:predicted nucleic acid-binding protein
LSYLLDTNIVSQSAKSAPLSAVVDWLAARDTRIMFLSVISLAEIQSGILMMPVGKKRNAIVNWFQLDIIPHFQARILLVTPAIAIECGELMIKAKKAGTTPDHFDALIAATAKVHGYSIVTLNRKHFEPLAVPIVSL